MNNANDEKYSRRPNWQKEFFLVKGRNCAHFIVWLKRVWLAFLYSRVRSTIYAKNLYMNKISNSLTFDHSNKRQEYKLLILKTKFLSFLQANGIANEKISMHFTYLSSQCEGCTKISLRGFIKFIKRWLSCYFVF